MKTEDIKSVIDMPTEHFPFAIYGILRDFAQAIIELKEKQEETDKIIRNLSIEVNEHINK